MQNTAQIAYWNGDAGRKWARHDATMARLLAPITEILMTHADVRGARVALDVGCGAGSGTLMLCKRLGPDAQVLGIDVSEPMLELAEQQRRSAGTAAASLRYLCADASTYSVEKPQFDLLFSRFGVMFFEAPAATFHHLRRAMLPGAQLAFCCWQAMEENPWTCIPLAAALKVLPPPAPPPPRAPGPFAFAERDYVEALLAEAGWSDIRVVSRLVKMRWPKQHGLEATAREILTTGPVSSLLIDADETQREAVYALGSEALAPYDDGEAIALDGAVWIVTARNYATGATSRQQDPPP